MKYADFGTRLIAHVIDNLITVGVLLLGVGLFIFGVALAELRLYPLTALLILASFGAYFGFLYYNFVYLIGVKGASWGKRVMGIEIVDKKGQFVGQGRAFIRFLVKNLCFLFSLLGVLAYTIPIMVSDKHQSLGDLAADGYVVFRKKKK